MILMIRIQVIELDAKTREEDVLLSLDNVQHSGDRTRVFDFARLVYSFICKGAV